MSRVLKKIWTGLIPEQARLLARLLQAYFRLPRAAKRVAADMVKSRLGLEGQRFRFTEDGLCCTHNCDFLSDPAFLRAYGLGKATGSWGDSSIRWRAYVVCWAAGWASSLRGNFVECGVNKGGNARMIIDYLGGPWTDRTFFLLDTFEGFDAASLSPEERTMVEKHYHYSPCLAEVTQTFAPFAFVKIIAGRVPDTLTQVPNDRVAFLSIDMNCVAPEAAAAEHFWNRLVPGGIMVLDDYGSSAHFAQKQAFDAFAAARGVSVLSLPTGQGLIFCPGAT